MDAIPAVWKEQRLIRASAVDVRRRLRPHHLFAYLLDAAWNHAHESAYGYEELSARNLMWVMIKMQVIVARQPRWGDQVTLETWGKRTDRFYALRDFVMCSASGDKLVSATSAWFVVHQASGRPQRFDQRAESLPWQPDRNELETSLARVPELQDGKLAARYRVHFSDIDVNRHVGSAKYLEWIIDSHAEEHLEASELASFDISFLAEAKPHDEVAVFTETSGSSELCSVRRAGEGAGEGAGAGQELCRAALHWRASR